jgi:hypothetical protein
MKTLLFALPLLFCLLGCNPNNPGPNLKTVRYETTGSIPYDILYTNQTGSWNTISNHSGNWSIEFQCESGKLLSLKADRSNTNNITGAFTSKIYIDGVIWMDATGDVAAACQNNCP